MFIHYRRRSRGKRAWLNLSKYGVSASGRAGRLTVNTRGRATLRLAKGLSIKI